MAKRKRPVALFEVINKDKRFERHTGALKPPAWWFKGRPAPVVAQTPSAEATSPPPPATTQPNVKVTAEASGAGQFAGHSVRHFDRFAPLRADFARLKRRLYARLTPASVGIIGATLVVLGLAVLASRWRRQTDVEAILKGPPHPEVLDVGQARANGGVSSNLSARPASAALPPATAAGAVQAPARQVNMGYVVI
ncbi:MAG: hypothetical protein ABSH22_19665, partial [Tepidisphaeraceae bacterium]